MREIERFEVRAADGQTWRFALMERAVTFKPLKGGTERLPGGQEYVSLDDPNRYHINRIAGDRFSLVDFGSTAPNIEVTRT